MTQPTGCGTVSPMTTTTTTRPAVDVGPRTARRTSAPASAQRWMLLGGPLLVVLYVLGGAIAGSPPAADSPARELAAHWAGGDQVPTAFLALAAALAVAVYGAGLAGVLREHGDDGPLPSLTVAGAAVAAAGLALQGSLIIALVDAAEDVGPAVVVPLQVLSDSLFMPMVAGIALMLLGAGLSARRSRALPAWLAVPALVLGAVAPLYFLGYATFMLGGIWIAVTGILLARRTTA